MHRPPRMSRPGVMIGVLALPTAVPLGGRGRLSFRKNTISNPQDASLFPLLRGFHAARQRRCLQGRRARSPPPDGRHSPCRSSDFRRRTQASHSRTGSTSSTGSSPLAPEKERSAEHYAVIDRNLEFLPAYDQPVHRYDGGGAAAIRAAPSKEWTAVEPGKGQRRGFPPLEEHPLNAALTGDDKGLSEEAVRERDRNGGNASSVDAAGRGGRRRGGPRDGRGRRRARGVGMRVPAAETLEGRVRVGAPAPCEAAGRADGRGDTEGAGAVAIKRLRMFLRTRPQRERRDPKATREGEGKRDWSPWIRRGGARPSSRRRR